MNKRNFLAAMICAPAIVRGGILMPIRPQIILRYGLPPAGILLDAEIRGFGMVSGRYWPSSTPTDEALGAPYINRGQKIYISGFVADVGENGILSASKKDILNWRTYVATN